MRAHYPAVSTFSLLALAVFLLALAGCRAIGIENKRVDYKSGSAKTQPLDVPPDLTALVAGDRYVIPDSGGEIVTSYSEYSKGEPVRQQLAQSAQSAVLPTVPNAHIERSGNERWLVVGDNAENVWPKVKVFWQENGFTIQTDNPDAGLIETDWAENRVKIPQGGLRAVIGKVFDKLYSSGEKDSYRTRLERRKDGSGTEIYIRHRGMAEVFSSDKSTSTWQQRPNDPEMEASMLQLLMVRLGSNAAAQSTVQEASADSLEEITPQLVVNGIGRTVLLNEPFDKCWRRVGLALEKTDIVVDDRDRTKGVYFVSLSKKGEQEKNLLERLKFWRDKKEVKKPEPYRLIVFEVNAVCRVNASNSDDRKDEGTTLIIESLFKKLSK